MVIPHAVRRLQQRDHRMARAEWESCERLLLCWSAHGALIPHRVAEALWRRVWPDDLGDRHERQRTHRLHGARRVLHGTWLVVMRGNKVMTCFSVGVEGWADAAVWLMLGWYEDRAPDHW